MFLINCKWRGKREVAPAALVICRIPEPSSAALIKSEANSLTYNKQSLIFNAVCLETDTENSFINGNRI